MVGPNSLLLFTIIFIFKDASSNIVAPHLWGFLFIKGSNSHYRYTGQTLVIEGT